ncbi:MAG: zinc ribbon domain-containing protein [Dehalococcoidia bacterium]
MPIYEYRCADERTVFQSLRSMSQMDEPIACPSCGSESKRVLSLFATIARGDGASSFESFGEGDAPSAGGGCCGGSCGCGASLN